MTRVSQAYGYRADPAVPAFPDDRPVIVFDGHCVMCSGWARFILRHDRQARYRLLPAQTPLGQALYRHLGLDTMELETNILIENGVAWFKSESSIRMFEGLGRPWSFAAAFRLLPLGLRDRLYEFIARNRFRIFGRLDRCYVAEAGQEDRFLA